MPYRISVIQEKP